MPRMLLARWFHVGVKTRLDRWALSLTPVLYKDIVAPLLELRLAGIVLRSECPLYKALPAWSEGDILNSEGPMGVGTRPTCNVTPCGFCRGPKTER